MKTEEILFGPVDSIKSRAIWNPSDIVKLYGGYMNWRLIKALKKVVSEFTHGCSMTKLEKKIAGRIKGLRDYKLVAWDGANHDSS